MAFEDILGLGKVLPLDKLLDVMQKGVGRLTKSHFERKDADTKAYEIRKLAEAQSDAIKIITKTIDETQFQGKIGHDPKGLSITSNKKYQALPTLSIEDRTRERINYQEARAQLNIENVTYHAAGELKNAEPVTNEPLNEDWINRFFKIAEDVSNEDMQALWGKILAGEVKKPNSFSIRTLELIKNISKEEAEIFMKIANYAVTFDKTKSYFIFKGDMGAIGEFKLPFEDISLLQEIGLLQSSNTLQHSIHKVDRPIKHIYILGNKVITVDLDNSSPVFSYQIYLFTKPGNELLKLIEKKAPEEYVTVFANNFCKRNVMVMVGDFRGFEGNNSIRCEGMQTIYNGKHTDEDFD